MVLNANRYNGIYPQASTLTGYRIKGKINIRKEKKNLAGSYLPRETTLNGFQNNLAVMLNNTKFLLIILFAL